jgi:predicted nucleic acid-binding protein
MSHVVVLDNEAVAALADPRHPKGMRVRAAMKVVAQRKRRERSAPVTRGVVPVAVRVEAGWDRREARWAFANSLQIADAALTSREADEAARLVATHGVSVADAHIGAVIASTTSGARVTVLTSDPSDVSRVAEDRPVTVVPL